MVAWLDVWSTVTTILGASTYLVDAGSNAATAYKYYDLYQRKKDGEVELHDDIGDSVVVGGVFIVVVSIMAMAHITNLLVFYLYNHQQQQDQYQEQEPTNPAVAAYFLPLVHLKRLLHLVTSTCSTGGFKDMISPQLASLYNILAAALETGPQLIFQYAVLHAVGSNCATCKLPKVLLMSIIASLVSGAYNGGAAIVPLQKPTKISIKFVIGITSGTHILCALIIRSLAFSFVVTGCPNTYIALYACLAFGVPFILFWVFLKPPLTLPKTVDCYCCCSEKWRRFLYAMANGHVSLSLGPLYSLVKDANTRGNQGRTSFHGVLAIATIAHLMLDVGWIILIYKLEFYKPSHGIDNYPPPCTSFDGDKFLPCTLFLVLLSIATCLYVLSIIAYLAIDKCIYIQHQCWNFAVSMRINMPSMGLML